MSKVFWIANAYATRASWSYTRKHSVAHAQLGLYFPLLNGWREWKSKSDYRIEGSSKRGRSPSCIFK